MNIDFIRAFLVNARLWLMAHEKENKMEIKLMFDALADAIHSCPISAEQQNMVAYAIADQFVDREIGLLFNRQEFVDRSTREVYEDTDLISSYIRHAIS